MAKKTIKEEFYEDKKKALNKILNHYVAEYLQAEDYNKIIIANINSKISTNKSDKLTLKTQIRDNVKGQEEDTINELMEHIESKDELHWRGLNGE